MPGEDQVTLEMQPTVEITDPAEAERIGSETLQAHAENGPAARAPDPAGCNNNRFESCKTYIAPVEVYQGGQGGTIYLGTWDVYMTLTTRSEVRNNKSTVRMTTRVVVRDGTPVPGVFNLAFAAQRWNKADPVLLGNPTSQPLAAGETKSHQWDDWSPFTTISLGTTTYLFDWNAVIAGATYIGPMPGPLYTTQKIRCDQAQAVNNSFGCVNPSYRPTVVYSSAATPLIVENILQGQEDHGGLGAPFSDPLHRGYSTDNSANRDAACRSSSSANLAALGPPPEDMTNPSCDEYPFASTVQGGIDATVAWVPREENTAQGVLMAKFYRDNRVMPDDDFYVNAYN